MKKFMLGLLIGMALTFTSSIYADDIARLVGKQVEIEYPVILNGSTLSNKAPAIEGTSYAPVREIAEKMGLEVKFTDDTVFLDSKKGVDSVQTITKEEQIMLLQNQINEIDRNAASNIWAIQLLEFNLSKNPENENYKINIEENKGAIADYEAQKVILRARIAELQK